MREHDWIVASINNPNFTNQDFKDVLGMTEDNTQMLSLNDYKNSQFIKDTFKKFWPKIPHATPIKNTAKLPSSAPLIGGKYISPIL